jgi:hypothetical protein
MRNDMEGTFTDRDLRRQVIESLTGDEASYNVDMIVNAIQCEYGTVDINMIGSVSYWGIVEDCKL